MWAQTSAQPDRQCGLDSRGPHRHDDVAPSTRRYRPSTRLVSAVEWVDRRAEPPPRNGYFGASTGAGGALVAAGRQGQRIRPSCRGEAVRIWPVLLFPW